MDAPGGGHVLSKVRSDFTDGDRISDQIARLLGHQQTSTTYRYINSDNDLIRDATLAIESFHMAKIGNEPPEVIH